MPNFAQETRIYPVSFINLYVKRKLQQDPFLADVNVRGEISNFKRHSSGHLYLTLKDESGSVSLYEKTGQYQFYIRSMEKEGSGDLFQAFLRMKDKLEKEFEKQLAEKDKETERRLSQKDQERKELEKLHEKILAQVREEAKKQFEEANNKAIEEGKKPAKGKRVLLGITKARC